MIVPKPNNHWSLAVYILLENHSRGVTMSDLCRDKFHKFQTRLLEVEKGREHKLKIRRLRMNGKNRFGHPNSWLNYKSLANKHYLINLIAKLNRTHANRKNGNTVA